MKYWKNLETGIVIASDEPPFLWEEATLQEAATENAHLSARASARIAFLEAAKADALGLIATLADLEDADGSRTYPSKAACEAARSWLEKYA